MVRAFIACLAAVVLAATGCTTARERPVAPETVPTVTLTKREPGTSDVTLTFTFTNMDRVDWHGKSLHAQIVKSGAKPVAVGPELTGMPADVTVMIGVTKTAGSETVTFVPMWSVPATGDREAQVAGIDLPSPDGGVNSVTGPGI